MVLHTYDAETFRKLRLPVPDVYFSAEYGAAEEVAGSGRWVMLEAYDAQWLLPVHIREGGVATDAVSPYGYAGIYSAPEISAELAIQAWSEARAWLREHGCVSLFVRQSPLVDSGWEGPGGEPVVRDHPTIQLDVRDIQVAWTGMAGRSRTSIRKAEKHGLAVRVREALPEDLQEESAFRRLYEGGMQRRQASDRYLFSDDYYAQLARGLGANLLIAEANDPVAQRVVAASLLLRHGRQLHYHLSGSEVEAGRKGATNALLWAVVQWANHAGVGSFHLGGGLGQADSLYKFKASFGGVVLHYNAYGVILDEDAYARAAVARAAQLGVEVGFFCERVRTFPTFRGRV